MAPDIGREMSSGLKLLVVTMFAAADYGGAIGFVVAS